MKLAVLLAVGALALGVSSASAQDVRIGIPGGPGVSIGDGHRDGYRYRDRYRDRDRDYRRGYRTRGDAIVVRRDRRYRDYDRRRGDRVRIERD